MGLPCFPYIAESLEKVFCTNYVIRAGVPVCDILCVYWSIVRPILEYPCPVWHPGMSKKLTKDTKCIQKRCLKLLCPPFSYCDALSTSGQLVLTA